jgi:hypothetical protein
VDLIAGIDDGLGADSDLAVLNVSGEKADDSTGAHDD